MLDNNEKIINEMINSSKLFFVVLFQTLAAIVSQSFRGIELKI